METRPSSIADIETGRHSQYYTTKAEFRSGSSAVTKSSVLSVVSLHPADPSVAPPDGRCHFLALPRELRDIIYGFVVDNRGGVRMHDVVYGKRWEAQVKKEKEWVEVDRLQDVCQQLRAETEERGVRFNEVAFICEQVTGTYQLQSFIEDDLRWTRPTQEPTLQMNSHLRKIIAHSDTLIENGAIERFMRLSFVQFCERNPHITVIVRFNCTYDDGWVWLGMHYATCIFLRGFGVEVPDQVTCWQRYVDWLRFVNDIVQKKVPTNYRLTLTNGFELRREDFGGHRSMTANQLDELMEAGKRMFDEGC